MKVDQTEIKMIPLPVGKQLLLAANEHYLRISLSASSGIDRVSALAHMNLKPAKCIFNFMGSIFLPTVKGCRHIMVAHYAEPSEDLEVW